ncbi:MAG: hypothetical protein A3H93_18105 [Rhodocyclales bacterium RIFCSPLOWO2_02_FULL_63_24]|nr:MAG: hypothetical protein A3H93_18105 [Rhodocyclales bacterium RIFCSPLOWO2_02_FULL_63_24]
MSEPQTSAIGAVAGLGTALLGAQVDALVLGLMAAIMVSIWMEAIDDKLKAGSAALLSSLLAGYGSPKAAAFVAATVPAIGVADDTLRLLMAVCIGAAAPTVIPLAAKWAKGRAGQ